MSIQGYFGRIGVFSKKTQMHATRFGTRCSDRRNGEIRLMIKTQPRRLGQLRTGYCVTRRLISISRRPSIAGMVLSGSDTHIPLGYLLD